ncbi:MAG: cobalamin-binding protein [Candidatus Tectimicrobiota bacterium]|nr:MAG: cobalamin-binding protein [Candidatus Tectomicrobia bacterium]
MRIVSLLPSSTEILCALGLAAQVVGISHECDYPPEITDRPRLTAPKINPHADSRTIDRDVRALVREGLSVYRLDSERLRALQPDLIVTQDQCQVCAVTYDEVMAAARQVLGAHVQVLSLRPVLLQDIWDDIARVGEATGRQRQAAALLEGLFERVKALVAQTMLIRQPPRVAMIEWIEPLMLAGNWMPELIQLAGGTDGLCRPGQHSPTVAWETLRQYAPEVLLIAPCGYSLAQTLAELPRLQRLPGWQALPAVRQGRVYAVDGHTYFNRPGPRIVDSLELLAGLVHPDLFGDFLPAAGQAYQPVPP